MNGKGAAELLQERSNILVLRKWSIDCAKSKADTDLIKDELKNAKRIAKYGHDHIDDNSDDTKHYRESFISEGLRSIADDYIIKQLQNEYGNGADILGDSDNYKLKVTCDNRSDMCKKGFYAHMKDSEKTMNVCDAWFDPKGTPAEKLGSPYLEKTEDILKDCKDESKTKFKTLENFWAGKGKLAPRGGPNRSLNLAHGSYKVGKGRERNPQNNKPLCPDPSDPTEPGYCNPDLSLDNADTLAIMAGGIFWSARDQCDRSIDIGLSPVDRAAYPQDVPHGAYDEPVNDPNAKI
ncbi:MAG: hypothetical protein L6R39_007186 [Caloplaca ligustica]|nr:MAG: hypothetical protein L6R39_007186 [Caloplaca ligustica]